MADKQTIASFDVDPQRGFTPLCPKELPIVGGDEIADAGIYDLAIHHDQILQPVIMRDWAVESIEGLSDEAEQSRERLVKYINRVGKVGARIASRREERAATREPASV